MATNASVDSCFTNGIECCKPEDALAHPHRHTLTDILQSLEVAKGITPVAMALKQNERFAALGDAIATSLASTLTLPGAPWNKGPEPAADHSEGIALSHLIADAGSSADRLAIVSSAEERVLSLVEEGCYAQARTVSQVLAHAKTIAVDCVRKAAIPTQGLDHAVFLQGLQRFASRDPSVFDDQHRVAHREVVAAAVAEMAKDVVLNLEYSPARLAAKRGTMPAPQEGAVPATS